MSVMETCFRRLTCYCLQGPARPYRVLQNSMPWQFFNTRVIAAQEQQLPLYALVASRNYATRAKKQQQQKTVKQSIMGKKKATVPGPKADLHKGVDTAFHEIPIICIKATYNNTLAIVTDHNGVPAGTSTAGTEGFLNTKQGTSYAGQVVGQAIGRKALEHGVKRVRIKLKGLGPGRQGAVKGILGTGVEIVSITDVTPVPHNGYKPKKQRRI